MERLIVPVYLNQKFVFDLLAMLQGGISTVTSVSQTLSNTEIDSRKVSVGFGLSEAFSTLLKIDLSGASDKSRESAHQNLSSQERVHTPASLFFQLRNLLIEKKYLKESPIDELPRAGDFIEFEGYLTRNPIVETIDSLAEIMKIAEVFSGKPQIKQKGGNTQLSENQRIMQQITLFSESLKAGSTIDLTSVNIKTGHTAVITVETNFLNDPQMSDLVDGQFKIIGKVIKSVVDELGSINLLRKTALSKLPHNLVEETLAKLSALGSDQGFDIPELKMEIRGPAIQILPIAIYA